MIGVYCVKHYKPNKQLKCFEKFVHYFYLVRNIYNITRTQYISDL